MDFHEAIGELVLILDDARMHGTPREYFLDGLDALAVILHPPPKKSKRKATAEVLASFAKFKAAYPRPTGMSKAKDIWIAMAPSTDDAAFIVTKIGILKQTTWFGREQSKIPHATTFLNQKRWLDEPEQPERHGRRPDVGRRETPMSDTPPPPQIDRFTKHIWLLLTALEKSSLIDLIGKDRLPLITQALKALPLERPGRLAAEARLAKIEARLLELVIGRLSPEETVACRAEGEESIDRKMAERMPDESFRQSQRRAFERAVYRRTGLPEAF